MLKGINPIISPALLDVLMRMGHGDEITFADANFPAQSHAKQLICCQGLTITQLLEAILPLFPLDYAVDYSGVLMQTTNGSTPPVWDRYRDLLQSHENGDKPLLQIEKPEFYRRAANSFAVVATSESALFANLILRKGVIRR